MRKLCLVFPEGESALGCQQEGTLLSPADNGSNDNNVCRCHYHYDRLRMHSFRREENAREQILMREQSVLCRAREKGQEEGSGKVTGRKTDSDRGTYTYRDTDRQGFIVKEIDVGTK